jgi:hypothetical protein
MAILRARPGTTLLLISSDAFSRYLSATGAVPDAATGLLRITPAQFANLQSLWFTINGVSCAYGCCETTTDSPTRVPLGDLRVYG